MREKLLKNKNGFTLVELLAVMGLLVVIGAVTAAIIISTLRASNKTNQLNVVRQNGNFALQQISRTVQYAKAFKGVSLDGQNFTTDCTVDSSSSPTPAPVKYSDVSFILFDETQVTFACNPSYAPTTIESSTDTGTTDLIDTNAVKVSQCYFTCFQGYKTASPSIGINLVLSQVGSSNFFEKNTSVSFNTSVTMRNSNK